MSAFNAHIETERLFVEVIERGLADMKAGRVIENDEMMRWLDSWGTGNELPPPVSFHRHPRA